MALVVAAINGSGVAAEGIRRQRANPNFYVESGNVRRSSVGVESNLQRTRT